MTLLVQISHVHPSLLINYEEVLFVPWYLDGQEIRLVHIRVHDVSAEVLMIIDHVEAALTR